MSMIMQLIQAVGVAERQIEQQSSQLNAYKGQIDQVINQVQAAFGGSNDQYGNQMIQQLQVTKNQIDETLNRLNLAKEKLTQVRTI